jgi:hypothetical protein
MTLHPDQSLAAQVKSNSHRSAWKFLVQSLTLSKLLVELLFFNFKIGLRPEFESPIRILFGRIPFAMDFFAGLCFKQCTSAFKFEISWWDGQWIASR